MLSDREVVACVRFSFIFLGWSVVRDIYDIYITRQLCHDR